MRFSSTYLINLNLPEINFIRILLTQYFQQTNKNMNNSQNYLIKKFPTVFYIKLYFASRIFKNLTGLVTQCRIFKETEQKRYSVHNSKSSQNFHLNYKKFDWILFFGEFELINLHSVFFLFLFSEYLLCKILRYSSMTFVAKIGKRNNV